MERYGKEHRVIIVKKKYYKIKSCVLIGTHYMYYTELFEIIVGFLTTCHHVLQMQTHVISFYGVTSRISVD